MKATIETKMLITIRLDPGEWILGVWSVVRIDFEVFRDDATGRWFSHICYGNFRAVRRPDNYRGSHHSKMGAWSRNPVYPGFQPKMEHIPLRVIETLRDCYETKGVSPEYLPPPDAAKGRGPAR